MKILSERGIDAMTFDVFAENWLAIHGNFDDFENTYIGRELPKEDFENFLYYSAGFGTYPDRGLGPAGRFNLLVHFIQGDEKAKAYKDAIYDFTKRQNGKQLFGSMDLSGNGFTATQKKILDVLKAYFFNPDNLCVVVETKENTVEYLTLFQYIQIAAKQGMKINVKSLMAQQFIVYHKVERAKSTYLLGRELFTPASEKDFNDVLHKVYESVLTICSSDFLDALPALPCSAIAKAANRKRVKSEQMCLYIAKAAAIDMTLNDIVHLFGLNVADAQYSLGAFNGLVTIVNDHEYLAVDRKGRMTQHSLYEDIKRFDHEVDITIDAEGFHEAMKRVNACSDSTDAPKRMEF